MEVRVDLDGDRVRLDEAPPLFSMKENRFAEFDVTPDADRFIVLRNPQEKEDKEPADEGIVIIQNWFEEFREAP